MTLAAFPIPAIRAPITQAICGFVLCGVVVQLGSAGCGEVLGVDQYRVSGPATPVGEAGTTTATRCGGFEHTERTCAECTDGSCCGEAAACSRDPDCRAGNVCLAACGRDETCQSACSMKVPRMLRSAATGDLASCLARACAAECGRRCLRAFGAACDGCLCETCEGARTLATSTDTLRALTCRGNCISSNLFSGDPCGCQVEYPQETGAVDAFLNCLIGGGPCSEACGASDWSCVGEVEWPGPPLDRSSITLDVEVVHPVSGASLPGITIRPCAASDEPCAEPFGEATTDGRGTARLDLERRATLVGGFFGYLEARGPGILDTLMYLYPPVVHSSRWLRYAATRDYIEPGLRQLGLAIDGVHGLIGINVLACNTTAGGGAGVCVSVSDPEAVVYYLVGG